MAANIEEALEERLRLFTELKQAAEEQLKSLEQDDTARFSEAADRRDNIQERILKLDERIDGSGKVKNGDQRFFDAREEIKVLINKTLELDSRMVEIAAEKRDAAARDLDRMKKGREGVRGYGKPAPGRPKFVDKQG